jgi:putative ABC transport system permease protein
MNLLWMTVITALRALRRNLLRSTLTMLGVIIGVAAVIAMVSVGRGADAAVQQQIQSLGNNLLMIIPGATTANGVRSGWGAASTLTVADAAAVARDCPAVAEITWVKRQVVQVVYGNQNWSTSAQGVTPSYPLVRDWPVTAGRFFDEKDEAGANPVALLGQTVIDHLFEVGEDPIGATIRVKNVPFQVIGVLERKGQTGWGQDQDDVVIMPFSTAERRVLGTQILGTVDMVWATTATAAAIPEAERQVRAVLHERHRTPPGQEDDFTVRDLGEIAEASKSASQVMANLLLSIASVSLLVGGIGIMNIMLVSVTERTREIGVRLAVGARARHILLQFLVEATALSLVGGAAGVVLGIVVTRLIASLAAWPTLLSAPAAAGAFLVSGAIGIFFGFYPARRAARLDPIEALRYE